MVSNGAARNARELAGVSSRRRAHGGRVSGERGEAERSGRVHSARGVAVDVMRALGADERGHRRRTDDIWRTGGALAIPDGELGFDSENTATD